MNDNVFKQLNTLTLLLPGVIGDILSVSRTTNVPLESLLDSATELAKRGLSESDVLARTKGALILTRIAGTSFHNSVRLLNSAIDLFKMESSSIVNKMSNIDAKFAVSAKDLLEALSRAGSASQNAGVSFNELISLVTAAQQKTARAGVVIGNALKTIFTIVQNPDVLASLRLMGFKTHDSNGNIRPTIEILKDISGKYHYLRHSHQQLISEILGGSFQVTIIEELFGKDSTYFKAMSAAESSQNEGKPRNDAINERNDNAEQFKKKIEEYEGLAAKFLGLLNATLDEFKILKDKDMGVTIAQSELLNTYSQNYQYYSRNSAKFRQEYNHYLRDEPKNYS